MYLTHARGVEYDPHYESRYKSCYCVHPKIAGTLVGLLEVLHFLANLLLLIGAIIHHDRIWAIIFTAISLVMIFAMIVVLFVGISKERPHLIYVHLMYLIFSVVCDIVIDVYDKNGTVHEVANAYIIVFVIVSTITLLVRIYAVVVIRRLYHYMRCKNVAWANTRRPYYMKR
ncbi:hypothetical protein QR680_001035 [Steinernema hermaphroditum]|uniref:MARVEL domain-containing protein n=1 Tax=Steinernema hermaphroditum TaxID=289476 RepID=A0AA39LF89_9BILA|nr:hypothetical protein QR680_001035 [Steinernema hermaphroditum]